ncbi:hypothetical protein FSP39_022422 [Pinctada imbricata]|uniref:Cyclic GMP-AMP synthase n=1 Tax=Pinctada imbricata TaxID=66713 RepID=A0AA88XWU7_PINIB|nr:hypothetical protein FSP39_022422 [Pinctada imbricata]
MDLSTRLSFLFGTEEYVELRRQLILLREILMNFTCPEQNIHIICSGSLGEGVAYPGSDDDVMFSLTNCRVVMTYREVTQTGDVLLVPSELSPGYCRLLDFRRSHPGDVIHMIQGMPFVSSSLFKQHFATERRYIHGPCQSETIGYHEYDYAYCIPCYAWPDIANGWVNRERSNGWPSCEMIHNIVGNGCHVVPVGYPDSPYADLEWRISFSVAERTLMHSFNHAQFLVYNLLRLTLKRVIAKAFPGVLCSYFMKTTLFFTVENTPRQLWQVQNIETCFKLCLSVLYDYVDRIFCPNYFIPQYNMIKRKINHTNRLQILEMLRTHHLIGVVGIIRLSGESYCLDVSLSATTMEYIVDAKFMLSIHLKKVEEQIDIFFNILPHESTACSMLQLCKFWSLLKCNSTILESDLKYYIWNKGINSYCLKLMNQLLSSSGLNKQYYRLYKTLEILLIQGNRVDVTTGKLIMATYMYMVGKTESALYVLRRLLSEYPPYVIDVSKDMLDLEAYKDVMCGREFTISYKMRHAHTKHYDLIDYSLNAYPSPLKMWMTTMIEFLLDPLAYAYFLECLCHAQHQNPMRLMKSLRCLINHMDGHADEKDNVCTRMCVGIIKYVLGDSQSACRWLGLVYAMKDILPPPYNEKLSRSSLTYIACLLNKKLK